jgi:AcrR family transcriptional regulator
MSSDSKAQEGQVLPLSEHSLGEKASRAEKKAHSRRQILDSARDVFFRDGFMTANLDEVAERAGVAKGTLYRYFESKADLYVAVLADNSAAFTERMREVAHEGGFPAVLQVERISHFYYQYWVRHPEYFQIFWAIDNQAVIGALPAQIVDEVSALWESSLEILTEVLERGVAEGDLIECDCWEVANILWTTANALIQSEKTSTRRDLRRKPLEPMFHDAIRFIMRGLATTDSRLGRPAS